MPQDPQEWRPQVQNRALRALILQRLSLGTAPDAHVPRETQEKLPLTGTTTTPSVPRLTACGLVRLFCASPEV